MSATAGLPPPSAADARTWSARLPRRVLTVIAPVLVSTAIVLSVAGERLPTLTEVASAPWILASIGQGIVIASIPLLVVRPHQTIGWAALGAVGVLASPTESSRPVWAALALVLTLLALADAVGAARQRVVARSWAPSAAAPVCGPMVRDLAVSRRLVPTVVAIGGIVVAVVATAWWVHDDLAVREFRTFAQPVAGVVTSVSDDQFSAEVRLDTGATVHVPLPASTPTAGERVVVMTAPGTDRAELASDPFDPTGALVLGAGALLAAVVLLREDAHRRRASRQLLHDGGPVLTLVAVPVGGRWLALEPVGAPGHVTTRVRIGWDVPDEVDVEGVDWGAAHRSDAVADEEDTGEDVGSWDRDGDGYDGSWDRDGDGYEEWVAEQHAAVERLSDEELLARGSAQRAEREEQERKGPPAQGHLVGPTVVEVHGLQAQGDYPMLRMEGRWLVADRPARDTALDVVTRPLRLLGIRPPLDTRTVHRLANPTALQDVHHRAAPALWRVLVGATGSWLPWLLTPAVGWLAWWLADNAPWSLLAKLAPVLVVAYSWGTLAQDRLAVSAAGVRVRSSVLSTLVPWSRLERVVADDDSVVLRVVDPSDAITVHQHRDLGRFLPGAAGPRDVPRLVEAARRPPTEVRRAVVHRLTPGSAVLLAWVVAGVVGAILA